jgi:hypothetical protein
MMPRFLLILALIVAAGRAFAEDDGAPSKSTRQLLKEQLADHAKPGAKPVGEPVLTHDAPAAPTVDTPTDPKADAAKNAAAKPGDPKALTVVPGPAKVLPKVEVRKDRITKLDQELAKEDQQIAREKQNTKRTEMDTALNDQKIAKPLSIFGGESTQFRQRVANQRVALMEDEKDLLVAIAQAKTKAEKAELQKQLDELRAERRELERTMR